MFGFIVILFMTPSGHPWIINKMLKIFLICQVREKLKVWWKNSQKTKRACLFISEFRVVTSE